MTAAKFNISGTLYYKINIENHNKSSLVFASAFHIVQPSRCIIIHNINGYNIKPMRILYL